MNGKTKYRLSFKGFDEISLWSAALIILLILTILGEFAIPTLSTYIYAHIGTIVIAVLFIFLRMTYLYQDDIKNLIKKRFSEKTQVIFHRDDYYRVTYDAIKKAPEGSNILVTNFEKIDIPYDVKGFDTTGYKYEKKLMELWDEKVINGDLNVHQIVGVWSKTQIDEMMDRIKKFGNVGNYSLSVIKGDIPPVIVSSFVIQNELALLEFPADPTNPYMSNQALISEDPNIIKLCKSYFDVLWPNSILVKGSDGKKNNKIEEIISYGEKKEIFSSLSDNFNKICIDKKKHLGMRKIAEEVVNDCNCIIESIRNGFISLSEEEFDKLITITLNTSKDIKCTSYLQNINFWGGEYGKKIMEVNEILRKKGIKITRIFVLKDDELSDPLMNDVMQKQLEMGINVMFIQENKLANNLLFDFSIHDDDIIFEQLINKTGLLIGNRVSCHKRDLDKFKKIFKIIASKAQPFESRMIDLDTSI